MDEWTGGDLNPRPPECKSGIHTRLNYQPTWFSPLNPYWRLGHIDFGQGGSGQGYHGSLDLRLTLCSLVLARAQRTVEERTVEAAPKELTDSYAHYVWGTKCEEHHVQPFYHFF